MARRNPESTELTAKLLASLKAPLEGRMELADAKVRGLWYRLTASGTRTWALRYRLPGEGRAGTQKKYTIGDATEITLAEARRIAETLRADIGKGIDPAAARRSKLAAERAQLTLADMTPRWLARVAVRDARNSHRNYETAMRKHLLPRLGRLKVKEVERRHVAALHDSMNATPIAANRALACLSVFMKWAEDEGVRPQNSNPCRGIDRYPETRRKRFLEVAELLQLGRALAEAESVGLPPSPAMQAKACGMSSTRRAKYGKDPKRPLRGPYKKASTGVSPGGIGRKGGKGLNMDHSPLKPDAYRDDGSAGSIGGKGAKVGATLTEPVTMPEEMAPNGTGEKSEKRARTVPADRFAVASIRLMLLTGWRMAEVISTRWADVDLEKRVVVHGNTKGGATSRPLSAPACVLLSDLPRIGTTGIWVFPRFKDDTKHIGKPVRLWDAVRHAAGLKANTKADRVMLHDLRHTVGAFAVSSGASLVVIAALLGHKQVRTTEGYAHVRSDVRHAVADEVGGIIADALQQGADALPDANRSTGEDNAKVDTLSIGRAKRA